MSKWALRDLRPRQLLSLPVWLAAFALLIVGDVLPMFVPWGTGTSRIAGLLTLLGVVVLILASRLSASSALQARAREVYRQAHVPDPASAVIFFHGLGLSHMDIEQSLADGSPNGDWTLEDGMVVPVHLLYPGGEHERVWLEEVMHITKDGGRPLFSWGFEPLTGLALTI